MGCPGKVKLGRPRKVLLEVSPERHTIVFQMHKRNSRWGAHSLEKGTETVSKRLPQEYEGNQWQSQPLSGALIGSWGDFPGCLCKQVLVAGVAFNPFRRTYCASIICMQTDAANCSRTWAPLKQPLGAS